MTELLTCAHPDCSITFPPFGKKRFCSHRHKLDAWRRGVRGGKVAIPHRRPPEPDFGARVLPIRLARPARFCYADPVYPGCASLYPENEEVDHEGLIRQLIEDYPDGWALSTSSTALYDVHPMCPRGVRLGSWHRQHRPTVERAKAWEPVIFCGGRRTPKCVPDAVYARVPSTWNLPGKKPKKFYHWVFDMLGVQPGDTVDEPFPGSGGGEVALAEYLEDETFQLLGS